MLGRLDELEKTGNLSRDEKDALDNEKRRLNTDLTKDKQVRKAFEDTNIELDKQAKSIQEITTDVGEDNPSLKALKEKFKQIAGEAPEDFAKEIIAKRRSADPSLEETAIEKASKKLKEKLDKDKDKPKSRREERTAEEKITNSDENVNQ